jgi:hypothetical protein
MADLSKPGLKAGSNQTPETSGDTELVAALREAFLASGEYDPAGDDANEQFKRWVERELQAAAERYGLS